MNKKAVLMIAAAMAVAGSGTAWARGPGGGPPGRMPGPAVHHRAAPPPHHRIHHHSHSAWGRGGRNFWPSFVGGVIGGALVDAVVSPAPVVVQQPVVVPQPVVVQPPVVVPQPVYVTQNVWVEGRYVDQVQPNGTVLRVWQPGHYEQRQVLVNQ